MYIGKKLTSEQIQSSLSILYRKDYILIPLFLDNYTFSPTIANNYQKIWWLFFFIVSLYRKIKTYFIL